MLDLDVIYILGWVKFKIVVCLMVDMFLVLVGGFVEVGCFMLKNMWFVYGLVSFQKLGWGVIVNYFFGIQYMGYD